MKRRSILILAVSACVALGAFGEVPTVMNYQGRLLGPGGTPVNGDVDIAIDIYTAETGGLSLYREDVGTVTVQNGLYTFQFGTNASAVTAVLAGGHRWLSLTIDGLALEPRQRLLSTPYAIRSLVVEEESDPVWAVASDQYYTKAQVDVVTQDAVDAEGTARSASDGLLQDAIDQEIVDRIADVDAEETARETADAALEADIATRLVSNVWATADSTTNYLPRTGGTLSGDLDMGGRSITNIADGSLAFSDGTEFGSVEVQEWNTAAGWGDHSGAGYLTEETDPVYAAGVAAAITAPQTQRWEQAYTWGDHSATDAVLQAAIDQEVADRIADVDAEETARIAGINAEAALRSASDGLLQDAIDQEIVDRIADVDAEETARETADAALEADIATRLVSNVWATADSTTNYLPRTGGTLSGDLDMGGRSITNIADGSLAFSDGTEFGSVEVQEWNTAAGWGDHSGAGYLTEETDPVYAAGVASGIGASDTQRWAQAYEWGDHSATDTVLQAAIDQEIVDRIADVNAEEAARGAADTTLEADIATRLVSNVWATADSTTNTLPRTGGTLSGDLDMGGRSITNIADGSLAFSDGTEFGSTEVQEWNTAAGWGDHSGAGYLTEETDPVYAAGVAAAITAPQTQRWEQAYTWGDHSATDTVLQAAIDQEIVERIADVDAEEAARGAADTALEADIATRLVSNVWATADSTTNTLPRTGGTLSGDLDMGRRSITNIADGSLAFSDGTEFGSAEVQEWNTVAGWGDHSGAGYLTEETDPVYAAGVAAAITAPQTQRWEQAYTWGDHSATDTVLQAAIDQEIVDRIADVNAEEAARGAADTALEADIATRLVSNVWATADSTTNTLPRTGGTLSGDLDMGGRSITNIADGSLAFSDGTEFGSAEVQEWNTAAGWGDHSGAGYLTEETDPVYAAGVAAGIGASDTQRWEQAYTWGDHSATDTVLQAAIDQEIVDRIADVDAEEAARGAADTALEADIATRLVSNVWATADSTTNTLPRTGGTLSGDLDMGGRSITNIADGSLAFSDGTEFGSAEVQEWNTAAGWGDHSGAGYLTEETDPVYAAGVASGIGASDTQRWEQAYTWGDHSATDTVLQAAIDQEIVDRIADVDAEEAARGAADTALEADIATRLVSNVWATADSTTNYLPRTGGTVDGDLTITGNIGIGTASTGNKLEVNGSIKAKEVVVTQSSWPDYVFEETYDLMPLSELAGYIEEHGHLPGIPPAGIVVSEGVSLGEMQRQLLRHVEELTLRLIRMEEENRNLREQIEAITAESPDR